MHPGNDRTSATNTPSSSCSIKTRYFIRHLQPHCPHLFHIAQAHNAAHHAPARMIAFDDKRRVAGRVHALVRPRRRFEITRSAPHSSITTGDEPAELNHARLPDATFFFR